MTRQIYSIHFSQKLIEAKLIKIALPQNLIKFVLI